MGDQGRAGLAAMSGQGGAGLGDFRGQVGSGLESAAPHAAPEWTGGVRADWNLRPNNLAGTGQTSDLISRGAPGQFGRGRNAPPSLVPAETPTEVSRRQADQEFTRTRGTNQAPAQRAQAERKVAEMKTSLNTPSGPLGMMARARESAEHRENDRQNREMVERKDQARRKESRDMQARVEADNARRRARGGGDIQEAGG